MICSECGMPFAVKTRYNPTTKKNDASYFTYMHSYTLSQAINGKVCKNSVRIPIRSIATKEDEA